MTDTTGLSPRDLEIARLAAAGASTRDIAERLLRRMLKAVRILALCCMGAFGALAFASCGEGPGSRSSDSGATAEPTTLELSQPGAAQAAADSSGIEPSPEPLVIAEARLPVAFAESLELMIKVYPLVVVGEISGVIAPYDPRPGVVGLAGAPTVLPTYKSGATVDPEALKRPPGRTWTDYSLTVVEVLAGEARAGDILTYSQVGGIWEGRAHHVDHDPLVRVGQRYLFFLEYTPETNVYTAMPFARFEIGQDGSLRAVDEVFRYLPAVEALHNKQLQQARALTAAAETDR